MEGKIEQTETERELKCCDCGPKFTDDQHIRMIALNLINDGNGIMLDDLEYAEAIFKYIKNGTLPE